MHRSRRLPDPFLALVLGASLSFAPEAAAAQDAPPLSRTQLGIGYVANAPEAMLGGNVYVLFPKWGGIGIYADAKFDVSNPTDERGFDGSVTVRDMEGEVGGRYVKDESSWWSANVAVMRPLTNSFIGYVGGGIAHRTYYRLYDSLDPAEDVGYGGLAWVEDTDTDAITANFMFGAVLRLTSLVSTQFGYETEPGGLTIGAALRIPRW